MQPPSPPKKREQKQKKQLEQSQWRTLYIIIAMKVYFKKSRIWTTPFMKVKWINDLIQLQLNTTEQKQSGD